MKNKNKLKFEDEEFMGFRCERAVKMAFQDFCDDNNFNESAVLRRVLKDFLKQNGVEENDIKAK